VKTWDEELPRGHHFCLFARRTSPHQYCFWARDRSAGSRRNCLKQHTQGTGNEDPCGSSDVGCRACGLSAAIGQGQSTAAQDRPIAYIDRSDKSTLNGNYRAAEGRRFSYLIQELGRQALALTLCDELGLVTRDYWMGDSVADHSAIVLRFNMVHGNPNNAAIDLRMPNETKLRKPWSSSFAATEGEVVNYLELAERFEALSRTEWADALARELNLPRRPRGALGAAKPSS
jgi:hypothetical protein